MKELAVEKGAHKDIQAFAVWLNRNAKERLGARFGGSGPKLVATLRLDTRGLRDRGGLITAQWTGTAALEAAFATEQGASVARVVCHAEPAKGHLEPAGDRLLDDLLAFLAGTD